MEKHLRQTLTDLETGKVRFSHDYVMRNGRRYAKIGIDLRQPFVNEQAARKAIARMVVSELTEAERAVILKALDVFGIWKDV